MKWKIFRLAIFSMLAILTFCSPITRQPLSIHYGPDKSIPLFAEQYRQAWQASEYKYNGGMTFQDSLMILEKGGYLSGATWNGPLPTMDYEIELDAMRIDGRDFFLALTFPVDTSFCSLVLGGWGGYTAGLSSINGVDASENETTLAYEFRENTWYHVKLRVTAGTILAWINNNCIVDLDTKGKRIGIRQDVAPSVPLGLASFWTKAAYKNMIIRKLGM